MRQIVFRGANLAKLVRRGIGRICWQAALGIVVITAKADIVVGTTEADVFAEIGAPSGTMAVGGKKRLSYPHGSLTLVDGRVVTIDSALANWLAKRQSDQQPGAVRTEAETKPVSVPVVTGRIYAFPLSVRYYPTPAAYFTGSARTAWRQELAADREENIDPLMAVSYAVEAQSAFVYVPASYDGSREFGVYVDVRSESAGALPAGYDAVCDRHQLIWISPHASGNNVPAARRCALALDALASLQRRYRIDRRRIYAGGFSGGGTIAARLGVLYPEIVRGIMIHARGVYLADTPAGGGNVWPGHFSFLTGDDLRRIARQGLRVVFVTGPGDMNYGHVRASVAQWTQAGFAVKGFDVKGLGHEDAPADILNDAMVWLGEKL